MEEVVRFVERLKRIGIKVELLGNYPWVYLHKVNGNEVAGKFESDHRFTAFIIPPNPTKPIRMTNVRKVFQKVRENL